MEIDCSGFNALLQNQPHVAHIFLKKLYSRISDHHVYNMYVSVGKGQDLYFCHSHPQQTEIVSYLYLDRYTYRERDVLFIV